MKDFMNSSIYRGLRTIVKVFLAAALGIVVSFGSDILDTTMADWKAVLAAGIAAIAVWGFNFLNKDYTDYGIGSQ
jgi:hypothetical protein